MYHKRIIPYPKTSEGLFSIEDFEEEVPLETDTYTKLTISINKPNTLGRAKTFFRNYPNIDLFKQWFIETFFPFIINNDKLVVNIILNGENAIIKKENIKTETENTSFDLVFNDSKNVFSTTVCPDPWKNECKFGAILFRAVERGAGPYASERSPPSDKCGPDLSNRVPAISARTIFLF